MIEFVLGCVVEKDGVVVESSSYIALIINTGHDVDLIGGNVPVL